MGSARSTAQGRPAHRAFPPGLLALTLGNKAAVLSGTTGAAWVGRGLNNTYFNGTISEILVYNRVLSVNEAASVEYYLRNKFGTK